MIKAIPMEDWLRGCVYHDGRHGYVTLPADKVLQIANYIQRTRRSVSDGLIDLKVEPIADTPQTERKCIDCKYLTYMYGKTWCNIKCDNPHDKVCDRFKPKDEQTDCA